MFEKTTYAINATLARSLTVPIYIIAKLVASIDLRDVKISQPPNF